MVTPMIGASVVVSILAMIGVLADAEPVKEPHEYPPTNTTLRLFGSEMDTVKMVSQS